MPLVVFEGAEGCGKSTQLTLLSQSLRARGLTVHCTREPGGTPLAEGLRQLFKTVTHSDTPTMLTELLILMAARAQHTARILAPAHPSDWVLCDRYLDSSYVYQGILGGLEKAYIDEVAKPLVGTLVPHLTLVYLVSGDTLHQRLSLRLPQPQGPDRFDGSSVAHLEAMNQGYRTLCQEAWTYPQGVVPQRVTINGSPSPQDVFQNTWKAIETLLEAPCHDT